MINFLPLHTACPTRPFPLLKTGLHPLVAVCCVLQVFPGGFSRDTVVKSGKFRGVFFRRPIPVFSVPEAQWGLPGVAGAEMLLFRVDMCTLVFLGSATSPLSFIICWWIMCEYQRLLRIMIVPSCVFWALLYTLYPSFGCLITHHTWHFLASTKCIFHLNSLYLYHVFTYERLTGLVENSSSLPELTDNLVKPSRTVAICSTFVLLCASCG